MEISSVHINEGVSGIKRDILYSLFPGLLCAFLCVVGYSTKYNKGFRVSHLGILCFVGLVALFSIIISLFFSLYDKNVRKETGSFFNKAIPCSGVFFLLAFIMLFIVWIPSFLAFYPGLFVYDAQWQYLMYIHGEVTTHHPIIHTYLLGSIIDSVYRLTGSINKGIAAYTIVQELIMACASAYILYLLHRRKASTWLMILTLILFCLYPPFIIMVFSSTKDAFFAIVVAAFLLLTLELLEDRKLFFLRRSNVIIWIALLFLTINLRNNAIYAIACVTPFWIVHIFSLKEHRRDMLIMIGITIAISVIYKYPITNRLTVEGTSKAEMLSVPCQQLMRVYKYRYDELTDQEIKAIERFFDSEKWYGYYVPEIADATKGSLIMDLYEENPKEFYKTWIYFLRKYPSEYVDSFLENTYGFWYPWPHYVIYSFGGEGYTPMVSMQPAEMNVKLPFLYNILTEFENGDIVQKNVVVSWLFAPATFFYFALINFFYVLKEKEKKYILPFVFVGLLWGTFLLGPVAMFRYAFYLYALVPVWFAYVQSGVKPNAL